MSKDKDQNIKIDDLKGQIDEIETRLIEQEHRTVHVAFNAYKYFGKDVTPEKRKAAMKALFWRVFAPYTMAAIVAGGGTFIAGLSAYFLYQQNQKLEAQTELLKRQTEIAAGEGQWELLWQSHYSPEPIARLEAATKLANSNILLSGIDIQGSQPPSENLLTFNKSEQYFGMGDALSNLVELPQVVASQTTHGTFSRFRVTLDAVPNRGISNLRIVESEILLGSAEFIDDCTFERVVFNPQGHGQTIRDCIIKTALLQRTPMGKGIQFRWSNIQSMAVDSRGSDRSPTLQALDPSQVQSWMNYPIFFDGCDIGVIHIRQTSMTGFRASRIRKLILEDDFSSSEELRIALKELLGTDNCYVNEVEVRKMSNSNIDISFSEIAEAWIQEYAKECFVTSN
jgi:hypothetical protein